MKTGRRLRRRLAPRPGSRWHPALRDRGSYALETVIIAPVFIMLLGLVIAAGRIHLASGVADSAAQSAARSASLAREADSAQRSAEQAARDSLRESGVTCSAMTVTVDASGLNAPVGEAATVTADVSCTVALSDVGLPGLPGSKTLRSEFTSSVDRYRAR